MGKEKTNSMGVTSIRKMLIFMGVPMIISMALQALYNIIDTAFVSGMTDSEQAQSAITALTYAFPIQMLMIAIAIGTGVGANVLLSKSLGRGDNEKVNKTAGNAIFLGIVIFAVFLLFGLFGSRLFANLMTNSEIVADMTTQYVMICCTCSFGIVFFAVYEKLLQATGKTIFSTIAQIAGALTNIILDPVFIYEKGKFIGLFNMGIAGAAWATVIGQIVSTVLAMIFHYAVNKEVKNHIKYLKPEGKLILEIYAIGLPAIIAQALMSFMTMAMNKVLGIVDGELINRGLASENAPPYVSSYGVYYKVQQFVLFLAFGLRDAITPLVSFNYGMQNKKRIKDGIFYGILYTSVLMVLGLVVLECAAAPLTSIFDNGLSDLATGFCINAMHIISVSFIFAGINIALQGIFQSLGSGLASLIISVCRQLLFVIPVALIFAFIAKNDPAEQDWLLWLTFIISEGLSLVIAVIMMRSIYKKKIAPIGTAPADGGETTEVAEAEEVSAETQDSQEPEKVEE